MNVYSIDYCRVPYFMDFIKCIATIWVDASEIDDVPFSDCNAFKDETIFSYLDIALDVIKDPFYAFRLTTKHKAKEIINFIEKMLISISSEYQLINFVIIGIIGAQLILCVT